MGRLSGGIYTLACDRQGCDQINFDQFTFDSDLAGITCPTCGGTVHRIVHSDKNAEAPDLYSEAVGVHPSQIAEAQAKFPHHRFAPDGRMIFTGQREKDRVLKDLGFVDHAD